MPEDPGTPPTTERESPLNVRIPERLHRKLKIRSATTGVPIKTLIARLIEESGD